jgi:hypothetical protein
MEGKEAVVIGVINPNFWWLLLPWSYAPKKSQPHPPQDLFSVLPLYPLWRHGFSIDTFLSLCRQPFQRSSV